MENFETELIAQSKEYFDYLLGGDTKVTIEI
jgi:hypothetical protein